MTEDRSELFEHLADLMNDTDALLAAEGVEIEESVEDPAEYLEQLLQILDEAGLDEGTEEALSAGVEYLEELLGLLGEDTDFKAVRRRHMSLNRISAKRDDSVDPLRHSNLDKLVARSKHIAHHGGVQRRPDRADTVSKGIAADAQAAKTVAQKHGAASQLNPDATPVSHPTSSMDTHKAPKTWGSHTGSENWSDSKAHPDTVKPGIVKSVNHNPDADNDAEAEFADVKGTEDDSAINASVTALKRLKLIKASAKKQAKAKAKAPKPSTHGLTIKKRAAV
jgi:hypothetical protein